MSVRAGDWKETHKAIISLVTFSHVAMYLSFKATFQNTRSQQCVPSYYAVNASWFGAGAGGGGYADGIGFLFTYGEVYHIPCRCVAEGHVGPIKQI